MAIRAPDGANNRWRGSLNVQCSPLLVHFLIYAFSSPDGFLFVPSAHILSLFVFLLLLVLYLYQADMCFFWFCFCISSLDGFLFVPSRHMFLLILFFVLLADKAKTKKSQGWYRLVHPLVVWGKLHGPPLLLLQSARKPPDEGAEAPLAPSRTRTSISMHWVRSEGRHFEYDHFYGRQSFLFVEVWIMKWILSARKSLSGVFSCWQTAADPFLSFSQKVRWGHTTQPEIY